MQKKLIALAVAGLVSGAAFAQSNVEIYGVADGYYGYVKAGDAKVNPAFNSGGLAGSRIGFKGAEDLGNGMKAVFQYELGSLNIDQNDNGINKTRQSYVGLAGGFGTVVLGRLQTPGYYTTKVDALAASAISPQAILGGGMRSTIAPTGDARLDNAIAYLSPNFSGFSAVLAYAAGEQATGCDVCSSDKQGVWGLGLDYAGGPVAVSFVHHNISNAGGDPDADVKEYMLGGSYDLKMVKILGSYQTRKNDKTDKTDKLWQLGAIAPVGPGNVHFAYAKTDMDVDNTDSKSWTLAYTYGFSKRTTGYVGYNRTTNDDGAGLGMAERLLGAATIAGAHLTGENQTAFVVGLNHKF